MRDIRLGDDIDDFCVRCKRVTNHVVVSVLNGAAAKVRCRTCHSDHDFRNEQAPPPKVDLRKQALFNEVLKKAVPGAAPAEPDALADDILDPHEGDAHEADADAPEAEPLGIEAAAGDDTIAEAVSGAKKQAAKPAPKAKTKARK
jgi:hypothetical protein